VGVEGGMAWLGGGEGWGGWGRDPLPAVIDYSSTLRNME
jgi:hypothetical protein